ncbi:hypothetical protein DPEC_G00108460, partial [Dallia pectoralis]
SNKGCVNETAQPILPGNYTKPLCVAIPKNNTECYNSTDHEHLMCYKKGPRVSLHKYKLIGQNLSWYDAQYYCRQNYNDLVCFRNEREKEEVMKAGMNSTTRFWIGLLYDDWKCADGGNTVFRKWGEESVYIINESKPWEEAQQYCSENYETLLRIESEDDQRIVQQRLKGENVTGPVWIGLRQSRLFGFWVWTNSKPLRTEDWSYWDGGRQPKLPLSHQCAVMATEQGGFKWSDQDCLSNHYFICEE